MRKIWQTKLSLRPVSSWIYHAMGLSALAILLPVWGYIFLQERVLAEYNLRQEKVAYFIDFSQISNLWFASDTWFYRISPDWMTAIRFDIPRPAFDRMMRDMLCRQVAETSSDMENTGMWRPWWHPSAANKLKSYHCAVEQVVIHINVDAQGDDAYRVWMKAFTM